MNRLPRWIPIVLAAALAVGGCWDERPQGPDGLGFVARRDAAVEPRLSGLGSTEATLLTPSRLAVTPSGQLLVSDPQHQMVVLVNWRTLEPEQGIRIAGTPMAVGYAAGRIYVGNLTENRVEIYNPGGQLRYTIPVDNPVELAVDTVTGQLFVVDGAVPEVKVFDVGGSLLGSIGGPGSGWPLTGPTGLAVDPAARQLFVANYGRPGQQASVQIYDYDGNHLGEISGRGTCHWFRGCSGGFSRPQGVAVDAERLYLPDALQGVVMVFDRATGTALGTIGAHTANGGTLRFPVDVVIGKRGELFVTSMLTASVERFDRTEVTP